MSQKAAGPTADKLVENEGALISELRAGSPEAFEALVRSYTPRLLAAARRIMGNDADAQDCVQDALINAFRSIGDFEGRSSLATWLHRITVNSCISRYRQRDRKNEEPIDGLLSQFDQYGFSMGPRTMTERSADELLESADTAELVRQAMDQLPESYRIVLMLRDIEEYDTQEVAKLLDMTPGAVKTRLHRARSALKSLLQPLYREDMA